MREVHEGVRRQVAQHWVAMQGLSSTKELGVGSLILAGGLGGVAYWGPTYPMDVIKSRIQVDNLQHPQYRGMVDCFSKVRRLPLPHAAHLPGIHVILGSYQLSGGSSSGPGSMCLL